MPPDPKQTRATIETIKSSIRSHLEEVARVQPDVTDINARHALISLKMAADQMFTLVELALASHLREEDSKPK